MYFYIYNNFNNIFLMLIIHYFGVFKAQLIFKINNFNIK